MDNKLVKIARTGYAAKGTVYVLLGALTFMAALNLGGQKAGQMQVLEFLDKKPFGNILLLLVALGIACYSIWRFTQAFSDPENIGSDSKGKMKRFAFFLSGCSYLALGYFAILKILGSGNSGQEGQNSSLLMSDLGLILLGIAGAVILGRGLYQFYKAFNENFTKKMSLWFERRKLVKNVAKAGVISRGVLFVIIGYFAIRAAISSDPSKMKTTGEAFSFIETSSYGSLLLALIALGAVAYGVYMFLTAKYRNFQ